MSRRVSTGVFVILMVGLFVSAERYKVFRRAEIRELGRRAALDGMPPAACAYWPNGSEREDWLEGWQIGFMELKGK